MRIAIINVPTKVGAVAWERCFRETATRAPLFGINEVIAREAKRLYAAQSKTMGYGHAGLVNSPNPVFYNKALYDRMEVRVHTLHARGTSPLARRYEGFNDARSVSEVVLMERDTHKQIVVLNTHWVPEGKKVPAAWRAWARSESKRKVRKLIRFHMKHGRIVYLIGDTNIAGVIDMGIRRFKWIRSEGIDKIGVAVPKGTTLKTSDYHKYGAPTDHGAGVIASATFA